MAENINLRAINEIPVVESISDGDSALLVDANGAKQIPANKLGGSGGGGTIYLKALDAQMDDEGNVNLMLCQCYADKALTNALDYETGKKMIIGGAGAYLRDDFLTSIGSPSNEMGCNFSTLIYMGNIRMIAAMAINPMSLGVLQGKLLFSDTVMD